MTPLRSSLAVAAALALAACSSEEAGRITVRLTDAPGDVLAAVVTIDRITLHGDDGVVVLSEATHTVDLLSLANDTVDLVADAVVPAGTYHELRFRITGGYVEVEGAGEATELFASSLDYPGLPPDATVTGQLKMPSFAQSGLKVTMPAEALVVHAGSRILLVDFDVSQSFGHEAGNSGSWVMHPVIRGADLALSGNVVAKLALGSGVTLPVVAGRTVGLGDFQAVLRNELGGEERLPFAADAGTGAFTAAFRFLLPGSYTLSVGGPAGVTFATSPASPADVTVLGGEDALVAFTITSAAAAAQAP